ncbi:hypothetical protein AX14_013587 [Amanita brunnescens Koide BX004]|nr:hypothetical protein AX14_013587 [Amanita brunnescens Koide BX004]
MHRFSLVIITLIFSTFVVSLPAPADRPKLETVALEKLVVGNIIYAGVPVDSNDMADSKSRSHTGRKILNAEYPNRLLVVLNAGKDNVEVAYFATFKRATSFPANLKESMWYPVKPAKEHAGYEPLPSWNDIAQWVSLRQKYTITANPVKKVPGDGLTEDSVNLILAAMEKRLHGYDYSFYLFRLYILRALYCGVDHLD